MIKIILICYISVIAILALVTVLLIRNLITKLHTYEECKGIIVSFVRNRNITRDPGEVSVSPVIRYIINDEPYEIVGKYCSTFMRIGQEIDLLYSPQDCSKAVTKNGLIVAPCIVGGLTLLFIIVLVIAIILIKLNIVPNFL